MSIFFQTPERKKFYNLVNQGDKEYEAISELFLDNDIQTLLLKDINNVYIPVVQGNERCIPRDIRHVNGIYMEPPSFTMLIFSGKTKPVNPKHLLLKMLWIRSCLHGHVKLAQLFYKDTYTIEELLDGFRACVCAGKRNVVTWMLETFDPKIFEPQLERVYRTVAMHGKIEMIKLLSEHYEISPELANKAYYDAFGDGKGFSVEFTDSHVDILEFLAKKYGSISIDATKIQGTFVKKCQWCSRRVPRVLERFYLLHKDKIDIHVNNDDAFVKACYWGNKELAVFLHKIGANIHAQDDLGFKHCCMTAGVEGRPETGLWLLSVADQIVQRFARDRNFLLRCIGRGLEITQHIYKVCNEMDKMLKNKINVHKYDQHIVNRCGTAGCLEVAKWLVENNPELNVDIPEQFFSVSV